MQQRITEGLQDVFIEKGDYAVHDGDTILLLNGVNLAGKDRVHLHGVDAPELDQTMTITENTAGGFFEMCGQKVWSMEMGSEFPIGEVAKRHLEHLIDGQRLWIRNAFWDRFVSIEHIGTPANRGNIYASVNAEVEGYPWYACTTNLNHTMIGVGAARMHSTFTQKHADTEDFARRRKMGFWALGQFDPPAKWRKAQREVSGEQGEESGDS